ncbi:glycosyltransferase [Halalkalibacter akibai]|uniref:Glycosyltransferase 2-like domain-containing protein n=1 Tax=Halalkalibacter akibai (strain ATCC 43226 / DSM 21942 / CIP 109018 / JCM 9157 / 1139) TaxID=1236973 RepID=W4QVL6_HALA3|nr:glycosyltransferase [Halalkalibacter akibai]GAE36141.1 hypothetical protein JCM9157_3290 [Halalkalibacter akibai JCM 9157]
MKFSIVIPTHNRAEQLIMTLTAFNLQSFDHDQFEVIVVDDGSDDQTREAIDQFQASYRLLYISTGKREGDLTLEIKELQNQKVNLLFSVMLTLL